MINKKKYTLTIYLLLCSMLILYTVVITAVVQDSNEDQDPIISIDFTEEPLINIVRSIADQKNINIIPPQSGNEMKEKVSLKHKDKLPLNEAWNLVLTLLDLSDYTVLPKSMGLQITKKNADSLREPVPLYVGVDPFNLDESDNVIRYLYYFANIKAPLEADAELNVALRELLSTTGTFKTDPIANALLIQDKSSIIRGVMQFVKQFDQQAYQEKIDSIKLQHTDAKMIADLLNEYILKLGSNEPTSRLNNNLDTRKLSEAHIFAKGTKVIPITHSNSLLILGRPQVVEKLKDFIQNTLDQDNSYKGKSILHVLPLQYINAEQFAPVLQKIVDSSRTGGTGQSTAASASPVKGTERFFDEVLIRADKPQNSEESKYYGGNNLIIACRNDDFEQIKDLVAKIDTPQEIVLLEILVADLTIEDTRRLGTMTRNPSVIPLPSHMEIQSAQLDSAVLTDNKTTPTTIAPDLLEKVDGGSSIAAAVQSGSTLVSLNDADGKTWSMLQILKLFSHSKVISQPHVITVHNKQATIRIGSERLLNDETTESSGGSAIIKKKKVEAVLQVDITPRISPDNTVTLQIKVTIDDFVSSSNPTKLTREVMTSANVLSGNIFSLGGLTNLVNSTSNNETPGLGKIPVLGWLFKNKSDQTIKNNLTVFICPTIIQPKLRKGAGDYTKKCIDLNNKFLDDSGLFVKKKDPITRWFFNKGQVNALNENEIVKTMLNKAQESNVSLFKIEQPVDVPAKFKAEAEFVAAKDVEHNHIEKHKVSFDIAASTPEPANNGMQIAGLHSLTPVPLGKTKKEKRRFGKKNNAKAVDTKVDEIDFTELQRLRSLIAQEANPFDQKCLRAS